MNIVKLLLETRKQKLILLKAVTLSVPTGYNHSTQLGTFVLENNLTKAFPHLNTDINDSNFQRVSDRLQQGKSYIVKFFVSKGEVSTQECIDFLRAHKALLVGAQGLTLLYQLKKEEFPIDTFLVSLDIEENLYLWVRDQKFARYLLPAIIRSPDGSWGFFLPHYDTVWGQGDCFLCFCEL